MSLRNLVVVIILGIVLFCAIAGEGYFYFAAVQAGTYRLEISFQGFEAWKVTGIGVHPGDNLTVPKIALKAGAAVESIVVTAETAGVGLSSGEHSTLVTADQIGRLSTVGRDEGLIREYIRDQEQEDKRLDQLNMWR